jgi:CheY-like chemotaxis protein
VPRSHWAESRRTLLSGAGGAPRPGHIPIRVLIVDDDQAFRDGIAAVLAERGYEIAGVAGTLADARAALAELDPDAVLLDIELPDGDGIALARESRPRARILLTSTDAGASPASLVERAGAAGFVPKTELLDADLGRYLGEPAPQRLAVAADAPRLEELIRSSILDLFPRYYDQRQTASAALYVGQLDMGLVEDATYFVHESAGEIVACGGWSRRDKLYAGSGDRPDDSRLLDPRTEPARVRAMFVRRDWTRRGLGRAILTACERAAAAAGFRSLVLMATLPGEPLYRACGFREVARSRVTIPDGVRIECVAMERAIARS